MQKTRPRPTNNVNAIDDNLLFGSYSTAASGLRQMHKVWHTSRTLHSCQPWLPIAPTRAGIFRLSRLLSPDYFPELSKRCSRYQQGQCAPAITKKQPRSLRPRESLRWSCCASIRRPLSVKKCEGQNPRLRLHSQRQTSALLKGQV